MLRYFEGVRVFTLDNLKFNEGAAITIPGIGIFIGIKQIYNMDLLMHEFGHILQRRQKGFLFYWFKIAPVSLWSAFETWKDNNHIHMSTWTEWSANRLSYDHFKHFADWNFNDYPIQ